jgi:hypothetical protein
MKTLLKHTFVAAATALLMLNSWGMSPGLIDVLFCYASLWVFQKLVSAGKFPMRVFVLIWIATLLLVGLLERWRQS